MSRLINRGSFLLIGFSAIFWAANASGTSLKPETLNAWDSYVRCVSLRMEDRLNGGSPFLWIDEAPERAARVRQTEIAVAPADPHVPLKVPFGLIHDWIGAAFIPRASIHDVLSIVRNYAQYSEFYRPSVIQAKPTAKSEEVDRFSMVLMNKTLFSKIALQGDYQSSYVRMDGRRMYSVSRTTRIQEIAEYGTSGQHLLPKDEGTGLIWRVYSITRLIERDGGVYIEVEAIVLSRDIPLGLRWIAEPIVRRISRSSLTTALRQTRDAVECRLGANLAAQTSCAGGARAVGQLAIPPPVEP